MATNGFDRLTPWQARAVLAGTIVAAAALAAVSLSPLASGFADAPDRGVSDIELYRAEIARVHIGQSYYDAAAAELSARGYPTKSAFNWRMPLPVWPLGLLPDPEIGHALLAILALASILLAVHFVARDDGGKPGLLAGVWLVGALLPCFLDGLYVLHELWAGTLILLSILAYGGNRPAWGAAAALAALAIRELAAPYCGLCFILAIAQRRRWEVWFWLLAACAYGFAYGVHILNVLPRISSGAHAHTDGWVCFGGAAFVISLAQMNAFLLLLPQWVAAVALAAAMLGFAGWTAPWGRRAGFTASGYVVLFAIVGQPFNQYWGAMLAPLLCLGIAQAPSALAALWRRATNVSARAALQPA